MPEYCKKKFLSQQNVNVEILININHQTDLLWLKLKVCQSFRKKIFRRFDFLSWKLGFLCPCMGILFYICPSFCLYICTNCNFVCTFFIFTRNNVHIWYEYSVGQALLNDTQCWPPCDLDCVWPWMTLPGFMTFH